MEEEGGDDSDVIDAMEGWDSEDGDDKDPKEKGNGSDAPWLQIGSSIELIDSG